MISRKNGCAVMMDFENIWYSFKNAYNQDLDLKLFLPNLYDHVRSKYRILMAAAYADWVEFVDLMAKIHNLGLEIRFAHKRKRYGGEGRDSTTDMIMSMDGIQFALQNPDVDTFYLMTGNNNFTDLVYKLTRMGKEVILMGIESSTGSELMTAATQFVDIEQVLGFVPSETVDPEAAVKTFIKLMDRWERGSMSYIGLSKVAKTMLPDSLVGHELAAKFDFLNGLIEHGVLTKYDVEAPSLPTGSVVAIKLNREHEIVAEIAGELSKE
ncbi:MAG TPA: NYN domain-containing protein [Caldisericia bacterium]|nr:NYN domain-containing protein [Caldisericia bacterium]HPF49546.1 NYN domain-containing protein [Caldisericia bacterium]HPI84160.1 NYN domain-containing protein [Caldisericia bacterium]HPQ93545.1 NYN domain-containing protein [Caldisericia bacterium]HRV75449.1 NYN domain-containing protein [Caldisericia bacterium]